MKNNPEIHLREFLDIYWSHPFFTNIPDPWIRLSFLPSKYLIKKHRRIPSLDQNEKVIRRSELGEKIPLILKESERGWDSFYFLNVCAADLSGHARNENFFQYLWVPLDLDFTPHISMFDLFGKVGLDPAAVIQSSDRKGRARYQALVGIDIEDGRRIKESRRAAQEMQWAFGSDPVHDPKRIFRLPGTYNWKKVEKGDERSLCRVINPAASKSVNTSVSTYSLEDLNLTQFADSELSKELRLMGFRPISEGGKVELGLGATNQYGNWKEALLKSGTGKFSVAKGSRTNALVSWCGQMCMEGLHPQVIQDNLTELARTACEESYSDGHKDLQNILKRALDWRDKEDKKIESLFEDEEDNGHGSKDETGSGNNIGGFVNGEVKEEEPLGSLVEAGTGENETCLSGLQVDRKVQQEISKRETSSHIPSLSLEQYARRLAYQCDDQSRAEHINFLAEVAITLATARRKDIGSFKRFGLTIVRRLAEIGLRHGEYFAIPKYISLDTGVAMDHWTVCPMSKKLSESFFKVFIWELCEVIFTNRSELVNHPKILKLIGDMGDEDPEKQGGRLRFSPKGSFLAALVEAIHTYGPFNQSPKREKNLVVLQNGIFDVRTGVVALDDPEIPKVDGVWTKYTGLRVAGACAARWVDAVSWGRDNGAGSNGHKTPIFDAFLQDAFPGDDNVLMRDVGIWRIVGYMLLRSNPLQKLFSFFGTSGSGKGTLSGIMMQLCGRENCGAMQFQSLARESGLGPYEGKQLIVVDEAESGDTRLHSDAIATLKRASSGGKISVRTLYESEREIEFFAKFLLLSNEGFKFSDTSQAVNRRIVPVYFSSPKDKRGVIPDLDMIICAKEGHAIACRALIELSKAWNMGNQMFEIEGAYAMEEGRNRFQADTAPLDVFIRSCVEHGEIGIKTVLPQAILFGCIECWLKTSGRHKPPGRFEENIKDAMKRAGFQWANSIRYGSESIGKKDIIFKGFRDAKINIEKMNELCEFNDEDLREYFNNKHKNNANIAFYCKDLLGIETDILAEDPWEIGV